MGSRNWAICVSTSIPSHSLTPGGGGGSMVLICPQTGSILSSYRASGDNSSKSMLGLLSIGLFPESFSIQKNNLLMAYGRNSNRRSDTYAMLLSVRSGTLAAFLHWKCRLPEAQLSAGLTVSPCGHYVVAGGESGSCFVWSALGGSLLRVFNAHYRSVNVMTWSDCGNFLATGGADGMVHVFSLMDLVDENNAENQEVVPVRSWSVHHLPVTGLVSLPSDRLVSSSEDGKVVVMELFSEQTLATIQLPHSATSSSLVYHDGRLFVGTIQGSIYTIDLDVYAAHKTAHRLGATVKRRRLLLQHPTKDGTTTTTTTTTTTAQEWVFHRNDDTQDESGGTTELRGHNRRVTALAVLSDESTPVLVSGDQAGVLRVWDLESWGCVRVIQPWSHSVRTTTNNDSSSTQQQQRQSDHPVTSIRVVPRGEDTGLSFSSKDQKNSNSIVSLVTPLQRFTQQAIPDDNKNEDENNGGKSQRLHSIPVPFLSSKRDDATMRFFDVSTEDSMEPLTHRHADQPGNNDNGSEAQQSLVLKQHQTEIERLQHELAEARATVVRWETVNNKLMAKLQSKDSGSTAE